MRIMILPNPEGNLIAREYQFDNPEGWFVIEHDGTIWYSSPFDSTPRFVNHSLPQFREAVQDYTVYLHQVQQGEGADITLILQRIKALDEYPDPDTDFWPLIMSK
jgi:hypothetical protein